MRHFLALGALLALGTAGCSEDSGGGGVGGSGCDSLAAPVNNGFCDTSTPIGTCATPPVCSSGRPIDSCCVAIGEPGKDASNKFLKRTTDTKEYSDPSGAAPNLSCFEPSGYPAKPSGQSQTGKLKGVIKPFANGGCPEPASGGGVTSGLSGKGNAAGAVKMEVYTVKRTGDPATDGELDQLVGTTLTVTDSMPIENEVVDNCGGDDRPNRVYEYPNVPMDTELAIKTYSEDGSWRPLITYNIYVTASDKDFDGDGLKYDVRALAADDFNTIPSVAIGKTITPGNAAIGGEVHDCDNVRLQFARVDITASRAALVYFDDDEDNPLPDSNRNDIGTGSTALYSALDIKVEGESTFVRVAGTGLLPDGEGEKLVSLGYFDVRIFPNAVTSVTLRGLRPFQVP